MCGSGPGRILWRLHAKMKRKRKSVSRLQCALGAKPAAKVQMVETIHPKRNVGREYSAFLKSKSIIAEPAGIKDPTGISEKLFPFQRASTKWALQRGRAALFLGTGLGKTACQCEWARHVEEYTGKPVLILAPLAVSHQTIGEADKILGMEVKFANHNAEIAGRGIYITNYGKLDRFHPQIFGGVVWDESSILKHADAKTRQKLLDAFQHTPFRLACTATPAPNDYMELGGHCEALGIMKTSEMLATFFVHDGGETQKWRLKRHAEKDFWKWMASWCICAQKPSDIGFSDDGYVLPELRMHDVIVDCDCKPLTGELFAMPARTLLERKSARRLTIDDRVGFCYQLTNDSKAKSVEVVVSEKQNSVVGKEKAGLARDKGCNDEEDACQKKEISQGLLQEESCGRKLERKERADLAGHLQFEEEAEICDRPEIPRGNKGGIQALGKEESTKEKGATAKKVWDNDRAIRTDDEVTVEQVRDMRILKDEQEMAFSSLGPLPQDGESKGDTLQRMQFRVGKNEGQSSTVESSGGISREDQWIVWCGLNAEQDALAKMLGNECVSIQGSTSDEDKVRLHKLWLNGHKRVLVTKCSVFGFGLNWQHCRKMAFIGLSDSWESLYQAVRRVWRYGQARDVDVYLIISSLETAVLQNIKRKEADAQRMQAALVEHMSDLTKKSFSATARTTSDYRPTKKLELPAWL